MEFLQDVLSDEVVTMKFLLLCLNSYLLSVATGNRYQPKGSKKCTSITITGNITMSI